MNHGTKTQTHQKSPSARAYSAATAAITWWYAAFALATAAIIAALAGCAASGAIGPDAAANSNATSEITATLQR